MKVVLYLRYSSDNQTEQSIEGQRRVCEEFCKKNGHIIVSEYVDRATSAFKETQKRIQFMQMIEDAKENLFEGVVVYKLDRFARNRNDSAIFKSKLKKFGVKVISATENISDNPEGIILESVLEGMAEFYSMELSQKVKRGLRESILKGKVSYANLPYGYDHDEEMHYVINEKEAEIVRLIFSEYLNGKPIPTICREINASGLTNKQGKPFSERSFYYILKNERYIGKLTYEGITYDGFIPPIIDMPTWDGVQNRFANSKRNIEAKGRVEYLLSTKVTCAKCGKTMPGSASKIKGKTYAYYRCKTKSCGYTIIKKELIEDLVINQLRNTFNKDRLEEIADEVCKLNNEQIANQGDPKKALQIEIKELDKKIDNVVNTIAEIGGNIALMKKVKELTEQKEKAEYKLANIEATIQPELSKEAVLWYLTDNINKDVSTLVKVFVNKIVYNKETQTIDIQYFLTDKHDFVLIATSTPFMHLSPNSITTSLQVVYLK